MVLLTNFGWNQPNVTAGLEIYRGLRTRMLVHGIINHPWFHPTAWEDINSGRLQVSPTTRYYVFLDRDTCLEMNCPNYMGAYYIAIEILREEEESVAAGQTTLFTES